MNKYRPHGKGLKYGEKAKQYCFKLYSWEIEKIRNYIKHLRELKDLELKKI